MSVKGHAKAGFPAGTERTTPSKEEQEFRLRVVIELISEGRYKGEIKRIVAAQFEMQPRSVEPYIRKAFKVLGDQISRPVTELRSEAIAFYNSVMRDRRATISSKLRARERMDKILGLETVKIEGPVVGEHGNITLQIVYVDGPQKTVPSNGHSADPIQIEAKMIQ